MAGRPRVEISRDTSVPAKLLDPRGFTGPFARVGGNELLGAQRLFAGKPFHSKVSALAGEDRASERMQRGAHGASEGPADRAYG